MKILILSMLAAASIAGAGCATVDSEGQSNGQSASTFHREDKVTGSRLPRSDAAENYQSARTITGQEYRDYKSSSGLLGGP